MKPTPVEPLPPDVAALLETERPVPDVPTAVEMRVRERVEGSVGGGASGPGGASPIARPAPATSAKSVLAAGLAIAVGVGAGLAWWSWASRGPDRQRAHDPVADRSALLAPVAPPTEASPSTAPEGVLPPAPPTPGPESAAPQSKGPRSTVQRAAELDSGLAAERALLATARSALTGRDAAGALAAVATHAADFPTGRLVEEREALRVQALVMAGDYGAAREYGGRFRERYPRSILLQAVEAALGAIP